MKTEREVELEQALEFYADVETYRGIILKDMSAPLVLDAWGYRAREALRPKEIKCSSSG